MYSTCITVHVKKSEIKKFLELTDIVMKATLENEPKCKWFDLMQSSTDEAEFMFYEAYEDKESFDEHLVQPHTKLWLSQTLELFDDKIGLHSYNQAFLQN